VKHTLDYVLILVTLWSCVLPIPPVASFMNSRIIALFLAIVFLPASIKFMLSDSPVRWALLSIVAVVPFEFVRSVFFEQQTVMESIVRSVHAVGPCCALLCLVTTRRKLIFSLYSAITMETLSAAFAIAIHLVGEPFYTWRNILLSVREYELWDLSTFQTFASGLRGSVYLFGYDLLILIGMAIGLLIPQGHPKEKPLGEWKHRFVMLLVLVLSIGAMYLSGQRMPLVAIVVINILILIKYSITIIHLFISVIVALVLVFIQFQGTSSPFFVRMQAAHLEADGNLRLSLLQEAIRSLVESPFNPSIVYDRHVPVVRGQPLPPHVHLLTLLVRFGVQFAPVICYIVFSLYRWIVFQFRFVRFPTAWAFFFAFLGCFINGLTHNPGPWFAMPAASVILVLWMRAVEFESHGNGKDGSGTSAI